MTAEFSALLLENVEDVVVFSEQFVCASDSVNGIGYL